jgi:sigma-B regulation protein RsbU (phosphoserine phosphatase)
VCGGIGVMLFRRYRTHFREEWRRAVAQARERVRVREELALAREVQLSMLPDAMPELPWLDVAAVCLPAAEVGGDYYDFFPGEGTLTVAVADVAGHGLASGLVLATVRAGLSLLLDADEPLATALPRLNRLVQRAGRRMLVTLVLARFDQLARKLTVLTAGHPRVLVRRASGEVEELGAPLPPLGTRLAHDAQAVEAGFAPGDLFLLYTDGLVEATDADGAAYGHERLLARLREQPGDYSAADLCAALLADLYLHRGEAPQEDDLTLVALVAR